jgi:release factor glutamine methyltransferase
MLELGFPDAGGRPKSAANVSGAVRILAEAFNMAGLPSASRDARMLVAEACELSPEDLILKRDASLTNEEAGRAANYCARRLAREPVSRILGRREFWGLEFAVTPDTLDPRPETELIVETVLEHAKAAGLAQAPIRILDLGTGSGCILGALLSELPFARGAGVDRSEAALRDARNNLWRLGLADRASLLCASWMSAIGGGAFDVIVCNPPYIARLEICQLEPEVREHDPYQALAGGEDGLDAYRIIVPDAFAVLESGGLLVFEVGCLQGEAVLDLMKTFAPEPGFTAMRIIRDLGGRNRGVAGLRQS